MVQGLMTRAALDGDAAGLIELIGGAYAEYPGCILDVQGEEPDLLAIASAYAGKGGEFWVSIDEASGALVGSIGWLPSPSVGMSEWVQLRKLYVARSYRRRGLASELCARVQAAAEQRGALGIELWSDTRFRDAHRFYARRGFERLPETRQLFDVSQSTEYHFARRLVT
jgi:putative acetyltransferase